MASLSKYEPINESPFLKKYRLENGLTIAQDKKQK
jgi:hypothetical protein